MTSDLIAAAEVRMEAEAKARRAREGAYERAEAARHAEATQRRQRWNATPEQERFRRDVAAALGGRNWLDDPDPEGATS